MRLQTSHALGFGLAALFVLVASMFSGDYYDSRLLWFFLGVAVVAARRTSPERRADPPAPAAVPVGTLPVLRHAARALGSSGLGTRTAVVSDSAWTLMSTAEGLIVTVACL